ncbi:MAG: phosphatidylinositol-specific phospholipase C domain-containing protein, partial [Planctomycetota bacterium]
MLRSLLTIGLALALFSPAAKAQTDCDQHSPLCARRFHEVTYATTHNAFNHRGWFLFPNQDGSITEQLDEGVRGLMLDVHYLVSGRRSVPLVYHSFASLGFQPLTKVLGEVKRFLDREPGEVVTLILENYVDNEDIDNALLSSGLKPRLYTHDKAAGWPTLHDMIARDQRLVILNSKRERRYAWSTYVWDVAVETSWSNHALAD